MTDEQMQRKMEFIVEQQAQFAVNIQWFEEHLKRLEEERIRDRPRLALLEKSYQTVVDLLRNYDSRIDAYDSRMDRVEGESGRLENALTRFTEKADSRLNRVEGESGRLENALTRFTEKADSRLSRVETQSSRLENVMARFGEKSEARMAELESTSAALQTNMAALAAAQARSDEKLSAFIDSVRQDRDRPRN